MRQWSGLAGLANVEDKHARHALYELDRWIRTASTQLGALGIGQPAVYGAGGASTVADINQVKENEAINNATEGILKFGKGDTDTLAHALRVGDDGSPIPSTSVLDDDNSSTDQLGNGGTFVGTGFDCIGYSSVVVTVHSDQDSAAEGMTFEFSQDDSNWDDAYAFNLDESESQTRRFQFPITSRYFRVNYTNGVAGTAAFRVQTIFHASNVLTSIHRVDSVAVGDRSTQLMKSIIIGESNFAGGTFVNVKVNPSGALTVEADTEFPDAVAHADGLTLEDTTNVIAAVYGKEAGGDDWDRISSEISTAASVGQADDQGLHVSEMVKSQGNNFTGLNGDYDNGTPTRTASNSQANTRFRKIGMFVEVLRVGFPGGPIQIQLEYRTGSQWFRHEGPGGLKEIYPDEIGLSVTSFCWEAEILGDATRVVITGRGVDASNYYTIANDPPDVVGVQRN